ncbi:MAG: M28 family peptidase [bacterium]
MRTSQYRPLRAFSRAFLVFSIVAAPGRAPAQTAGSSAAADRIQRDVAFLASDALEGRLTGTPGNDSAAAFLAARVASLGLRAMIMDTTRTACRAAPVPPLCSTFLQPFTAHGVEMARAGHPEGVATQNVVAMVPGRDVALRGQYVVVGAHFDHLGRSTTGALDPESKNVIRNGADDNASGTAAVLELARVFAGHAARRSIIFVNFSGEEMGLLGSQYFVEHAPIALDSISAMLNFDMIGRLRNDKVIVYGVATATELPAILDSANVIPKLALSAVGDGFGPSDHASFYAKGIPVLHFFTDIHEDYHRASDQAEKINAPGEARIVSMAERVVRAIADRPSKLTPVRAAAPAPAGSSRESIAAYLGSIPDMAAGDSPGLRLSGVRAGSPADAGGLKAGDVIVAFGDTTVKDLYAYTDALRAHKPGDSVRVVYVRAGERRETTVTLGSRPQ